MAGDGPFPEGGPDASAEHVALGPREATWYYRKGLGKAGPVTTSEVAGLLADGRIGPSTLIVRTDRHAWMPPAYWVEFEALVARLVRTGHPPGGVWEESHLAYLRKRCLTMFGLFLAVVLAIAAHLTAALLAPGSANPLPMACVSFLLWFAAAGAGIYAVSFLRRSWRHVAALPVPIAIMGLAGCIGLIALTVLTALAAVGLLLGAIL